MKYKLLSTGYGVLSDRAPVSSSSEVTFAFEGAPENASAFFVSAKGTFYRSLVGGACSIHASNLVGKCEVGVILPDTSKTPCRWTCEGIVGKLCPGGVWIVPDDGNIPEKMARLAIEAEELRAQQLTVIMMMQKLREDFEKFFEGYDIV